MKWGKFREHEQGQHITFVEYNFRNAEGKWESIYMGGMELNSEYKGLSGKENDKEARMTLMGRPI